MFPFRADFRILQIIGGHGYAQNLRSLKINLQASKGGVDYFQAAVYTQFKGASNISGGFGNRFSVLEKAVNKITGNFNVK